MKLANPMVLLASIALTSTATFAQTQGDSTQWNVRLFPISLAQNFSANPHNTFLKLEIERATPDKAWAAFATYYDLRGEPFGRIYASCMGLSLQRPWTQGKGLEDHFFYKFSLEVSKGAEPDQSAPAQTREPVVDGFVVTEALVTLGYRWNWKHFSLKPELGIGPALVMEHTDGDWGVRRDTPIIPMGNVNVGLGYAF